MAIVKMKKLTLLGMRAEREPILRALQTMQCLEVTELQGETAELIGRVETGHDSSDLQRVKWALDKLAKYDKEKKPMFGQYPNIAPEESARVLEQRQDIMALTTRMENIERELSELRGQETRIRTSAQQMAPWQGLDASPDALAASHTVMQMAGEVPTRNLQTLSDALSPYPAIISTVGTLQDKSLVYVAVHHSAKENALPLMEEAEFVRENFSQLGSLTPSEFSAGLQAQEKDIAARREQLAKDTESLALHIPEFKILHDLLSLQISQNHAAGKSAQTATTFLLEGWVPAEYADRMTAQIKKISPACAIRFEDPADDEEPTILFRNGPVATAFEPVVEGFSLPTYRGIDPTAVMAPFYACLFGMMLSDAAYGLIMAVALLAFVKVKKIPVRNAKMLYMLIFCGGATVFWGITYNTFFGFAPLPGLARFFPLDAVNDPLPVMGLCLAIGIIHLFTGLGVAMYMNIRRGDVAAAICDQFSWFLLISGLIMLILPPTATVGRILALTGVSIILLFKRRDTLNPFKRLLSGLGALYGMSSWLSDILSYMRLFGMGLATGVIGMVFNVLISMVWSGGIFAKVFAVVLFIVCHLFNLGINALGAYVHSCRLQYIEFFGKFYEDGGKPFRPLDMKTRYVSIQNAHAE